MSDTARDRVNVLANIIRTADGDHSMGAGQLAEAICESDWLAAEFAAAKAEAWEEGWRKGWTDRQWTESTGQFANPYRTERTTNER